MIARGFKPMGWVGAVAAAALGCYMLSLNVAAERAELASIEQKIIAAKRDIRTLQTELGTRGRLTQLEHWNAEVLALSAPGSNQFLDSEFTLARFSEPQKTIEDRAVQVRMASVDAAQAQPAPKPAVARPFGPPVEAPRTLVRQASYVLPASDLRSSVKAAPQLADPVKTKMVKASKPKDSSARAAPIKKPGLIDDSVIREIGEAARAEKKGAAGAP